MYFVAHSVVLEAVCYSDTTDTRLRPFTGMWTLYRPDRGHEVAVLVMGEVASRHKGMPRKLQKKKPEPKWWISPK